MSHPVLTTGMRLGPYEIVGAVGAGGMGVVYRARDSRLKRDVAIKTLTDHFTSDPARLARFQREAEAMAAVNHPHVASMYDVIEFDGCTCLVLEFVDGETLRTRLNRGPIPVRDAVDIASQLASALASAHARGIVHRDIKPENVMLRPDGFIKVLDFGLAKLPEDAQLTELDSTSVRTQPGMVLGTPHYMSPEQARGLPVDGRSDTWSLGVVLFEMLAGCRPFEGTTAADVFAAILRTDAVSLDRAAPGTPPWLGAVVRSALAGQPGDRASIQDVQLRLSAGRGELEPGARTTAAEPGARTRIIALPFRLLRPDPDIDFLAFSLPDAVSASLANLESLIVRANVAAAHRGTEADLTGFALDIGVDMVVVGTLLRLGRKVRLTAQLVDGATGTLVWSHSAEASSDDLFMLQDGLVDGLVHSLALPLTGRDRRHLRLDVPASPVAYEYYLRANEASQDPKSWKVALALYRQAVELDPRFAPAWARMARVCRLIAKYRSGPDATLAAAEEALLQALQLNPDLSVAHRLHAEIDVDRGRADEALMRLVARARDRGGDADLFAALVHVCRYCGLLDASLAADVCARRIDASIDTGVMHTYWLLHRYEDAIAAAGSVKAYVLPAALVALGREAAARTVIAELERQSNNRLPLLASAVLAFLDGRHVEGVQALLDQVEAVTTPDPELLFYVGRHLAYCGEYDHAVAVLTRALERGHFCYTVLAVDPWLDGLRSRRGFQSLLAAARIRWEKASAVFAAVGGHALLGLS